MAAPDQTFHEEVERRVAAFFDELASERAFDSEFSPNPHAPGAHLRELARLGPAVTPRLVELSRSQDPDVRFHAISGLAELGSAGGAAAQAALEALCSDEQAGWWASDALEQAFPDAWWAGQRYQHHAGLTAIVRRRAREKTLAPFLERLLAEGNARALGLAVQGLERVGDDDALARVLRRILATDSGKARARAVHLLSEHPSTHGDEGLLEAALLSERVDPQIIDRFGAGPGGLDLVALLVRQEATSYLARLLQRRKEAGLATPFEKVSPLLERKLRFPKSEWPRKRADVDEAAECALHLGDPALLPALVDAVDGKALLPWDPLAKALASFGERAAEALEARLPTVTDPKVRSSLESLARDARSKA